MLQADGLAAASKPSILPKVTELGDKMHQGSVVPAQLLYSVITPAHHPHLFHLLPLGLTFLGA